MKIKLIIFCILISMSCENNKNIVNIYSVLIYNYKEINSSITTGSLFNEYKKKESDSFILLNENETQKFKKIILDAKKRNTLPSKLGKELLFGKIRLKESEILFSISDYFIFDITNNITYIIEEKDRTDFNNLVSYFKRKMNNIN